MKEKTWERNTDGLVAHAKQRAECKQQQADQAISQLLRENKPINFNAVAARAGVTKAYLYDHPELRARIETLRGSQAGNLGTQRKVAQRTDASRDILLVAKDRRIKALEEENCRLKEQLKVANGKLYERV